MATLTYLTAQPAIRSLVDAGDGRALRAMIREYTELALDRLSESPFLLHRLSESPFLVLAVLSALEVAVMARFALRHAENQGIIARLPDTMTPEEIEGIAL